MRPTRLWSWVGASATGTSHARDEAPCDDAGACLEVSTPTGRFLVAVVSDGAGSARMSRFGSAVVTRSFCRSATTYLRSGGMVADIDENVLREWLDETRDRIGRLARAAGEAPRAFAATLVGIVAGPDTSVIAHVGDGACVIRLAGEDEWRVPIWPAHGEYAGTTYFVTDDPEPNVKVARVEGAVQEFAVFTDGMERLALDFVQGCAFGRFFEGVFPPLRKAGPGRDRNLSSKLRDFMDSERVTERTDDDKTLVLARLTTAETVVPAPSPV